jgi:pilus assembly protein Flp/PilA
MFKMLRKLPVAERGEEEGASAVEYGLLVALIAAVIIIAVFSLGGLVKSTFDKTCTNFTNPGPISGTCTS